VPGQLNGRVAQGVVEELNRLKHKWRGRSQEMAYQLHRAAKSLKQRNIRPNCQLPFLVIVLGHQRFFFLYFYGASLPQNNIGNRLKYNVEKHFLLQYENFPQNPYLYIH
jgi:hypothetical protein